MIEPIEIPDATAEPAKYKQALLDLIGDKDPLEAISNTAPEARRLLGELPLDVVTAAPEPGEWSAAEIIAHIFDVDIVYGFRWRLVLTEENPVYPGYDEKRWTPLPRLPFPQLLTAWEGLRASNVVLISSFPRDQWHRTGVHGEQGPETFDEMVRKVAAHDIAHLNQIERAVETLTTR
ncbi:DinB family protein [Actinacidiphila sp. ITFR-21]|uniref:DinB family protein n=1 Tax=Actinacidiphila sp. ITFR-21 TaxID=3075199 RepID=UPI00288A6F71|nr:DinB family protein [Streptomyces sp. ITFR-21]WNI14314.1 DinB family protein [Streptomyces sp. ITFR-21]